MSHHKRSFRYRFHRICEAVWTLTGVALCFWLSNQELDPMLMIYTLIGFGIVGVLHGLVAATLRPKMMVMPVTRADLKKMLDETSGPDRDR
jgi:hypothetical protein